MKKRLLSAALALAMVLTLLPVSVFAAPSVGSAENPNKAGVNVYQQTSDDGVRTVGKWYWDEGSGANAVYHEVSGGAINGTSGNRGTWYSLNNDPVTGIINANGGLKTTSFTLLDTFNMNGVTAALTTLSVNVNGNALTLPSNIDKLGTLNITNSGSNTTGTVTGITKTGKKNSSATPVSGLTLNVTNATVNGIQLEQGATNTINLHNGAIVTNITLDGSNTDNKGNPTTSNQSVKTDGSSIINGAITITGGGSGSQVNLVNVTGSPTVNMTAVGSTNSVKVSGQSVIGAITVTSTATSTSTNVAIPSVDVSGGTVTSIIQSDTYSSSTGNVTVSGATVGGVITMKAGTVTINNGSTVGGTISVPSGSLLVNSTTGVTLKDIDLTGTGVRKFDVKGSNVRQTGAITANNGKTLTVSIPYDRSNHFGTLSLAGYTGQGILGGVFQTQADDLTERGWFGSSVKYAVKTGSEWAYWNDNELSQAIASIGTSAQTKGNITLVGHAATYEVIMKNGSKEAHVGFDRLDSFTMPQVLLGDPIVAWTLDTTTVPISGPDNNWQFVTDMTKDVTVYGQDAPVAVGATKLESVKITGGDPTYTSGIRVGLVGNVITLSGAVTSTGGYTGIPLELTTDAIDSTTGKPVTATVTVVYKSDTKAVTFGMSSYADLAAKGIVLTETSLSMNNGKNVYTLNGSGLGVPAPNLNTAYNVDDDVKVTVTKAGWNQQQKDALAASMTDVNSKQFNWRGVPAVEQAINAAQLSINNATTVNNWINTARTTIWRQGFKNASGGWESGMAPHSYTYPTGVNADKTTIETAFAAVWLVPYLQVTVTDVNEASGYMTLTLTPSYRLDVSADGVGAYDPAKAYTVQAGRSLGAITGDFGSGVTVDLKLGTLANYMHQDGTYVYTKAGTSWTITHGSNNGLGSMVINSTAPAVTLTRTGPNGRQGGPFYYDSLQAAVDDTVPQSDAAKYDTITVGAGYTGNGALTMSGKARIIKVNVEGNTIISSAASGDLVSVTGAGHDWTVQLLKDTNVATKGNITVKSATGGSASVNHNPASTGQTVTITLSPNAGYSSSGVSVKDSSGKAVSVSGSGNTYTFTMPAGTVTVTPSFTQTGTTPRKATVSVSPNSMGTTTTTAAATNNQVDSGSSVGVTTAPASGYRTMGVNISTNGGATTAVRQGDNYFTFTVPANATAVTVTPIYDRDNGTKFSDVWSTEYYSKSVAWAVGRGVTDGTSTYAFSPSNTCTRAQMMTFLWRAAGRPSVAGISNPFVDVSPTLTPGDYYSAILWAVSKGITNGTDATHFSPSRTVSRAQAVTFLYRYAGSPTASTNTGFYDTPSSEYYARAVSWASAKGITNGTSTNYFSPSQGVSRAQAVTFLYRHITGDIA